MYRYTPEALQEAEYTPYALTVSVKELAEYEAEADDRLTGDGAHDKEVVLEYRKRIVKDRAILRSGATLVDRREMLRVKLKSLMEEARIIRREEMRTWGPLRQELHNHRTLVVRSEARHAHLAYGLIRGLTIDQMEENWFVEPDWLSVGRMIKKYGSSDDCALFNNMFDKDGKLATFKMKDRPPRATTPRPGSVQVRVEKSTTEQKQEEAVQATAAKLDPAAAWPFPILPRRPVME